MCRALGWGGLLALLVTGSSCGLLSSPRPVGLAATPVGPTLEKMWRAHGGTAAWRRHGSVRATMVVEGDPRGRGFEETISFCLQDWRTLEVGSPGATSDMDLSHQHMYHDPHDLRSVEDYHLRAARFFLHLPFTLSQTGWSFRIDVFDESEETPHQFWALPSGLSCPHLGYYVHVDRETGLLERVIYQVNHPRFAGRIFNLQFRDYRWINGIQIATTLIHREAAASRKPAAGVPVPSSAGRPSSSMARWTLRYNQITFDEGGCEEEEDTEEEVPAT